MKWPKNALMCGSPSLNHATKKGPSAAEATSMTVIGGGTIPGLVLRNAVIATGAMATETIEEIVRTAVDAKDGVNVTIGGAAEAPAVLTSIGGRERTGAPVARSASVASARGGIPLTNRCIRISNARISTTALAVTTSSGTASSG